MKSATIVATADQRAGAVVEAEQRHFAIRHAGGRKVGELGPRFVGPRALAVDDPEVLRARLEESLHRSDVGGA
jgi:hypothetical protein